MEISLKTVKELAELNAKSLELNQKIIKMEESISIDKKQSIVVS